MITKESTEAYQLTKEEVLQDYRLACESRQVSILGRREVFMGKAKFGIFSDGKEMAQIINAKFFRKGDFRAGYYRDQTFMFASGNIGYKNIFSLIYAHTDLEAEPVSGGRQMTGHFNTRSLNPDGTWRNLMEIKNSSADISPTAAQMPRLVGLAYASKLYKQNPELHQFTNFSHKGNEIAIGSIGDAATSEGHFFEAINAAGVLQIPMMLSIWDDGYGISVPAPYHTTKEDISKVLEGFRRTEDEPGIEIFKVRGWHYEEMLYAYAEAERICRQEHVPVVIHVYELTQPQGHSTSGSHERYKSKERLAWEQEYDCIKKTREWILENGWATEDELSKIEKDAKQVAKQARDSAWKAYVASLREEANAALQLVDRAVEATGKRNLKQLRQEFGNNQVPLRSDSVRFAKKALRLLKHDETAVRQELQQWLKQTMEANYDRYNSHQYSESAESALKVKAVPAQYSEQSVTVDGREVMQTFFDAAFSKDPRIFAIGEDVGYIGDVNQGMAGLQARYGELRVSDTGIRELSIVGQGIGAALRGLRPICEIQYFDYIYYALQPLTDDLSCLQYRTKGGQKAPVIIRTRGHRLEGIWHSGSPMGAVLHSLRGMHVLVPRNMTQAAGLYNTMLKSDEPALIIETLNAYRLKEQMPDNIGEYTVPLGIPEMLREGEDVTIVTYGAMCRIAMDAAQQLADEGISAEVIDVQTLLPFDREHRIVKSLEKTNRLIVADEDMPGGATGFMLQQVLEEQGGYYYLDSEPRSVSAQPHRPAYATDGDYFSKPNAEDLFDAAYGLMNEADPKRFPDIY